MKTGPAIAEILKKEGVEFLFAYPVNHLIEACAAIDIRPIIVRQERIGLHMADWSAEAVAAYRAALAKLSELEKAGKSGGSGFESQGEASTVFRDLTSQKIDALGGDQ